MDSVVHIFRRMNPYRSRSQCSQVLHSLSGNRSSQVTPFRFLVRPTGKHQSYLFGSYRMTTHIAICLDPRRASRARVLTSACFYSLRPPPDMIPVLETHPSLDCEVLEIDLSRAVEFGLLARATR